MKRDAGNFRRIKPKLLEWKVVVAAFVKVVPVRATRFLVPGLSFMAAYHLIAHLSHPVSFWKWNFTQRQALLVFSSPLSVSFTTPCVRPTLSSPFPRQMYAAYYGHRNASPRVPLLMLCLPT